ncbi:MAG TPA: SPOR domain-containing protein, partial [Terriglobia bacterium]|nr:SPOR domain-containing protein [Terriglobia bacterium]
MTSGSGENEKGISFRQLVVAFLAVVALCAVFFSLGFFVGYKERTSSAAPATETVTPPSDVPQPVNPPVEGTGAAALGGTPASSASNTASGPPAMPAEQTPGSAAGESNLPNPSGTPAPPAGSNAAPGSSENASPGEAPERSAPVKGVTVQVAALSNRADAESLISVLKARGYAPFVMSPDQAHANDSFFRVVV